MTMRFTEGYSREYDCDWCGARNISSPFRGHDYHLCQDCSQLMHSDYCRDRVFIDMRKEIIGLKGLLAELTERVRKYTGSMGEVEVR